jgi:hypothetical protein
MTVQNADVGNPLTIIVVILPFEANLFEAICHGLDGFDEQHVNWRRFGAGRVDTVKRTVEALVQRRTKVRRAGRLKTATGTWSGRETSLHAKTSSGIQGL